MNDTVGGGTLCCCIDNEETMRRECWENGEIVASISVHQMMEDGFNGHPNLFFGLNVGRDWKPGLRTGDIRAMQKFNESKQTT